MSDVVEQFLGHQGHELLWWQMCVRAVVLFVAGVVLLRAGGLRILGHHTVFDLLVTVAVGSVLARAVTGAAPVFGSIAASITIVLVHTILATLATWSHRFGKIVKGKERVLVRDGVIDWNTMNTNRITEHDLRAAIRLRTATDELEHVKVAQLERTGEISVVLDRARAGTAPSRVP